MACRGGETVFLSTWDFILVLCPYGTLYFGVQMGLFSVAFMSIWDCVWQLFVQRGLFIDVRFGLYRLSAVLCYPTCGDVGYPMYGGMVRESMRLVWSA